jgi:RNA polymerase sigma factor (sigma-70 family)
MAHAHAGAVLRHLRRRLGTSDLADLSDRELLQRFSAYHDEAAFEALLQRHGPLVLGVCRRVLADRHAAEDAFQATFVVLVRRAKAVAWRESVAGWLFEVARRIARQARAAAARHRLQPQQEETMTPESPLSAATQRELRDVLDEELQRLPEKYRAPVVLCYLEGRSNVEAARLLGWSKGTVSGRLARARDLLRQRLARRGWGPAAGLAAPVLAGLALSAAVPAALADAATRAALQSATDAAFLPAGVAALANRALREMAVHRLRLLGTLLLTLAAVSTGVVVLAQPASPPLPAPAVAQTTPDAAGQPAEETPRLDRYGDLLPDGALVRLGTLRFRHELLIHSIAVAPDGKSIASGGSGHAVRLWDAATGKELRRFPSGDALSVAFAPDGKSLAFPSHLDVLMCDVATGKELQRLHGHTNGICGVAFSPDGRLLASASHDKTVRLWDTATGKDLAVCQGHQGTAYKVAFFPDGKTLASAGLDKTVRIWEASSGNELSRLEGHTGEVYGLAIAPDGKTLATSGQDKTVRLWDVASGKELRACTGHENDVHAVVFSPDGKTLASGCHDNTIRFWDVATGKEQRRIEGLKSFARALAFLPDGRTLASGGSLDSTVHFWDVATGKEVRAKGGHEGIIWSVRFAADDRTVYSVSADRTCRVWSAGNGEEVRRVDVGMRSGLSADGKLVASWKYPEPVRLWDVVKGEERLAFEGQVQRPWSLTFAPDGKVFACACPDGVMLWDVSTGRRLHHLQVQQPDGQALAFTPDSKTLLAAAERRGDSTLCLWDVATGKERRRLPVAERALYAVAFTPDGKTLAIAGEERGEPIRLWDVANGKELYQLSGHTGEVYGLTFSPDGRLLASASADRTVRVWELASDRTVKLLRGHQSEVMAVAFAHDGTTLATGDCCAVLLWDLTGLRKNGRLPELHPSAAELEATWRDLGGADGPAAFQAFWRLTVSPRETAAFLGERLKPVSAADPARITRLIGDLDSDQFAARDAAGRELEQLAERAEPALRKLLAGQPSPEARRRAEMLVRQLEGPILPRERLQQQRALTALERIGGPQARQVFATLAEGSADAWLTQQAKAALERLEKTPNAP